MVAYKAAQLWITLPAKYKNLPLLDLFKSEIKNDIAMTAPAISVKFLLMI